MEAQETNNVLPRHMGALSMFSMAFGVLNTWCSLAAAFSLTLGSGGPAVILWGLVVAGICNLCLAASLAEFLTTYPTAGGQYHWVAILSCESWSRELAWMAGWLTSFGWIALAALASLQASQVFLSIYCAVAEECLTTRLVQFGVFEVLIIFSLAVNLQWNQRLDYISNFALIWSIIGIIAIPLIAAVYTKNIADPSFAFTYFINETGWSDIMASTLGLLQAGLALIGFDAVSHMIEEMPDPKVQGPKIMVMCVVLGVVTSFAFVAVLLIFSGGFENIDRLINSQSELEILLVMMNSPILVAVMGVLIVVSLLFGLIGIVATSGRVVFALARDKGLPASQLLCRIESSSGAPGNALIFSSIVAALLGILFLVSDVAFSAIASASVSALSLSYAFPVILNCFKGRPGNMTIGTVIVPRMVGILINGVGILYSLITSVLFFAPPRKPQGAEDINYAPAVFMLVLALSMLTWYAYGRKEYEGPRIHQYDKIATEEDQ